MELNFDEKKKMLIDGLNCVRSNSLAIVPIDHCRGTVRRSIEYQIRYLATLYTSAIGALWWTLKLECHIAHAYFWQTFLTKEAQFGAVQHYRCCVVAIRLNLNRMLEEHMERVARPVREKFGIIFGQHTAQSFQIDLYIIICCTGRWSIQSKANDEYAFVHRELYRIAAATIAPLIAAIGTRLESMAHLSFQAQARLGRIR